MPFLHNLNLTPFVINDDLMTVNLAVVGIFVCGNEVFLVVKLHKTVPARLAVLVAHHADGLDDAVLLGGENHTSNSYFSVF